MKMITPPILFVCDDMPKDTIMLCPAIPAELFSDWPAEPSLEQAKLIRDFAKKCVKITGIGRPNHET